MKEKPFPLYSVNANLEGHWKFLMLKEKLNQPDLILRGLLTGIWKQACIYAPNGVFIYPTDQVIKQAGWQEDWGPVEEVITALRESGFIENGEDFEIHDWYENQPVLEKRMGSRNPDQTGQSGQSGQTGQKVPKKESKLSKESKAGQKNPPAARLSRVVTENPYDD